MQFRKNVIQPAKFPQSHISYREYLFFFRSSAKNPLHYKERQTQEQLTLENVSFSASKLCNTFSILHAKQPKKSESQHCLPCQSILNSFRLLYCLLTFFLWWVHLQQFPKLYYFSKLKCCEKILMEFRAGDGAGGYRNTMISFW